MRRQASLLVSCSRQTLLAAKSSVISLMSLIRRGKKCRMLREEPALAKHSRPHQIPSRICGKRLSPEMALIPKATLRSTSRTCIGVTHYGRHQLLINCNHTLSAVSLLLLGQQTMPKLQEYIILLSTDLIGSLPQIEHDCLSTCTRCRPKY